MKFNTLVFLMMLFHPVYASASLYQGTWEGSCNITGLSGKFKAKIDANGHGNIDENSSNNRLTGVIDIKNNGNYHIKGTINPSAFSGADKVSKFTVDGRLSVSGQLMSIVGQVYDQNGHKFANAHCSATRH